MARFFLRFARPILLLGALTTVCLGWFALHIELDFSLESLFRSDLPEFRNYRDFERRFGGENALLSLSYECPDTLQPAVLQSLRQLQERLRSVPGVTGILSPATLIEEALRKAPSELYDPAVARRDLTRSPLTRNALVSADATAGSVLVRIEPGIVADPDRLTRFLADLDRARSGFPFPLHPTGIPVIQHHVTEFVKRDLATFLPLSAVIFFILTALYYRSLSQAVLPMAVVGAAILWTLGILHLLGLRISVLTNMVPALILIMGTSGSIHILNHYHEQLTSGLARRDALARVLVLMIPSCFLTHGTTALSFLSLLTAPSPLVREFGAATALGMTLSYASLVTILPCALDLLPPPRRLERGPGWFPSPLAKLVTRRPGAPLAVALALASVGAYGSLELETRSSWLQEFRPSHPVHRAHEFMERRLASPFLMEFEIDASPRSLSDPKVLQALDRLETRLRQLGGGKIRWVAGPATAVRELTAIRSRERAVASALLGGRDTAREVLRDFSLDEHRVLPDRLNEKDLLQFTRALSLPILSQDLRYGRISVRASGFTSRELYEFTRAAESFHREELADMFRLTPTGKSWVSLRASDAVVNSMLGTFPLVAAVFFFLFAAICRSWSVGLLSMIPNLVPLVCTAGIMGHFSIPLNFTTTTIFSISLGLAVDNTIHFLSRFRLEIGRVADPREAARLTLMGAGPAMAFSSLLLAVGFAVLLTSDFQATWNFGLLCGVTVVLALLGDLFLTPSILAFFRPRVTDWPIVQRK